MADPTHVAILQQGVISWNTWRQQHPEIRPDLEGVILSLAPDGLTLLEDGQVPPPLMYADFISIDLHQANLRGADLHCVIFCSANFQAADLSQANLSEAQLDEADLREANLRGATLTGASLSHCDLSQAHLDGAILTATDFTEANLQNASLTHTTLRNANLTRANLRATNLSHALLPLACFRDTYFQETTLSQAIMGWTLLSGVDLQQVKGLETVRHIGPSEITVSTFLHSKGHIPERFLIDIGVPLPLRTQLADLIERTLPQQEVASFICCSPADALLAERLQHDIQAQGLRCWVTMTDNKHGFWNITREQSFWGCDQLVVILSDEAVRDPVIQMIINVGIKKEHNHHQTVVYPLLISEIRSITIEWKNCSPIDATAWQSPDGYQQILSQLLTQLTNK